MATQLLNADTALVTIQDLLGHTPVASRLPKIAVQKSS